MKESRRVMFERLFFLALICFLAMFSSEVRAYTVDFHGYLESNIILRDSNGFHHTIGDQFEAIQQKNTLKFDADVDLGVPIVGDIALDKAHFTYRGYYDSIYNLRGSEYETIPNKHGKTRFDYGLDDIKHENDLREATFDITYRGSLGSAFLRPGRQLVSWGEAQIKNLCDVVNPLDASNAISAFPDELKTPLWMGRLVYNIPPQESFGINFDLVVIPDVRPTQLGPFDHNFDAPYMREMLLGQIGHGQIGRAIFGNPAFRDVYEHVPQGRPEYGGRVTVDIGENLSVSGVYFRGINDSPSFTLKDLDLVHSAVGQGDITHPWMQTMGGYFNAYISPPLDLVLKGEWAYQRNISLPRIFNFDTVTYDGSSLFTSNEAYVFDIGNQWSGMLGFNRNFWARWLSPSQVNTGFEWVHTHTCNYDAGMKQANLNPSTMVNSYSFNEDVDVFDAMVLWYWWNGRISPLVFVAYDTSNAWLINLDIPWTISKHWKAVVDILDFEGNPRTPKDPNGEVYDWMDVKQNKSSFAAMIPERQPSDA